MQNSIFLLKRALSIWDLKKFVRKQDWFFTFCVHKNISQKIAFCIKIRITMTAISKRQRPRFYIYINKIKLQNVFVYKNSDTLQKARQFPLRLIFRSSNWNSDLLNSQLPCKVGYSLTINFMFKIYINGKGRVVCVWC